MTTWAKFFFYGGKWHFQGFTEHDEAVAEFEDFCEGEDVVSVVLALQHPPGARTALPARPAVSVKVEGDLL